MKQGLNRLVLWTLGLAIAVIWVVLYLKALEWV